LCAAFNLRRLRALAGGGIAPWERVSVVPSVGRLALGGRPGGRPREPGEERGRSPDQEGSRRPPPWGAGARCSSEGGRTLSVDEGAARRGATRITGSRKRRCRNACVHRRRNVEVEHVQQLGRVQVTRGQVRARRSLVSVSNAEESLLDEREQRRVIAY